MSLIEKKYQPFYKKESEILLWPTIRKVFLIIPLVLLSTQLSRWAIQHGFLSYNRSPIQLCPQAEELLPLENRDVWNELGQTFKSPEFRQRAVDYLGGAVRVPYATLPLFHYLLSKLTHATSGLNHTTKWVPLVPTQDGTCLACSTNTF